MKRILLIGDPDSLWIKRYVENALYPAGWLTVIYPIYGWKGTYREDYARMETTIYKDEHRLPIIGRIPKVRMWARVYANAASLQKLGPFDAVHCHYLSVVDMALGQVMAKQQRAPLVATFWGSDLLRTEEATLRRMTRAIRACRRVTVFNQEHVARIRHLYGDSVAANTAVLDFGEVVFPCIDKVQTEGGKGAAKAHFGIAPDQLTVCVGSSASKAQQQLPALQSLAQLEESTLRRITLILQHTYAHDDPDNEQKVQAFAKTIPCQTLILTDFLNDMESAYLRCAADVYLHPITTDAFSTSMKEYLYAGAKVAYGGWLTYPTLDELELPVRQFADFDALPQLINDALAGSWQPLTQAERDRLGGICKWESLAPQWLGLYGG
ncbi:MAG: glycosyltransferase family 4 protein [Clostridiales bacterium]|nr:glycosyltransferase family 4 protein [Clostridiales bacterium]